MRAAIFVELFDPNTSGVVVSVETLIEQLTPKHHEIFVFTPKVPGHKDYRTFPIIRLPSFGLFGKRFAKPFLSKKIIEEVKSLNLDLIHIQGPYATGILGVKLGKKLGIPVVMTFHTHVLLYLKTWTTFWNWPFLLPFRFFTFWIIHWISKQCQFIIAPSHFIKKVLVSYGVKTRIEVLPTGVQLPFLPQRLDISRTQLGLPEGVPEQALKGLSKDLPRGLIKEMKKGVKVLLYIGRISKEKNLELLIRAFEQILRRRDDVVLALVGDGPQRKSLEKIVRRKMLMGKEEQDWVFFLGSVPHNKVWSFLEVSDVFVFPSRSETQGLSVAEAMAAGKPVVVVGEGGAPEFIDDKLNGIIVPNDPKEFAKEVLYLLDNPGFSSYLGRNAQEKIYQFRPEVVYQRMEEFYLQFAKEELMPARN